MSVAPQNAVHAAGLSQGCIQSPTTTKSVTFTYMPHSAVYNRSSSLDVAVSVGVRSFVRAATDQTCRVGGLLIGQHRHAPSKLPSLKVPHPQQMGEHRVPSQPSLSCGRRRSICRSISPRSAASIVTEPAPPPPEDLDPRSLTQRIMEATEGRDSQTGGAGGAVSYTALKRADQNWARIRTMKTGRDAGPAPETVKERRGSWKEVGTSGQEKVDVYDVVICGGTLGVFLATALQLRGKKVAIVERGVLMGVSNGQCFGGGEKMAVLRGITRLLKFSFIRASGWVAVS